MNSAWRAIIGALLGSVVVSLALPSVRPFLLDGFLQFGPSPALRNSPNLLSNKSRLPDPGDAASAADWLQTGARQIRSGDSLTRDQGLLLAEISQAGVRAQPGNGLWGQMEAAFQLRLGNREAGLAAWTSSSLAKTWDDGGAVRSGGLMKSLADESGRSRLWHRGAVELALPDDAAWLAGTTGRAAMDLAEDLPSEREEKILMATLSHVSLLAAANRGVSLPLFRRVEKRLKAKNSALLSTRPYYLAKAKSASDTRAAQLAPEDAAAALGWLPGAALGASLAGGVLLAMGWLARRYASHSASIEPGMILLIAVLAGAAAWKLSGEVWPGAGLAVLILSSLAEPQKPTDEPPRRIPAGFRLALLGISLMTLLTWTLALGCQSRSVSTLLAYGQVLIPVSSSSASSAALLCLGLPFGAGQLWSLRHRIRRRWAVPLCLIWSGGVTFVLGLAASLIFLLPVIAVESSLPRR